MGTTSIYQLLDRKPSYTDVALLTKYWSGYILNYDYQPSEYYDHKQLAYDLFDYIVEQVPALAVYRNLGYLARQNQYRTTRLSYTLVYWCRLFQELFKLSSDHIRMNQIPAFYLGWWLMPLLLTQKPQPDYSLELKCPEHIYYILRRCFGKIVLTRPGGEEYFVGEQLQSIAQWVSNCSLPTVSALHWYQRASLFIMLCRNVSLTGDRTGWFYCTQLLHDWDNKGEPTL